MRQATIAALYGGNRHYSARCHTGVYDLRQAISQALSRAAGTIEGPLLYLSLFPSELPPLGLLGTSYLFDCVGFLVVCFLTSGPNATFNLLFLGLGWPWVGEFVGFMIIFYMFSSVT